MIEPQEFADMHRGQLVAAILELRGCHEFTAGRLAEVEARAERLAGMLRDERIGTMQAINAEALRWASSEVRAACPNILERVKRHFARTDAALADVPPPASVMVESDPYIRGDDLERPALADAPESEPCAECERLRTVMAASLRVECTEECRAALGDAPEPSEDAACAACEVREASGDTHGHEHTCADAPTSGREEADGG